jgi:hypothetical protein
MSPLPRSVSTLFVRRERIEIASRQCCSTSTRSTKRLRAIAFFHPSDLLPPAAICPSGRSRRAVHPIHPPRFHFFRCRNRRDVLVQPTRVGLLHMVVGECPYDHRLPASKRTRDANLIARPDVSVWLCGLAVDLDFAALARALGLGTRPKQTGHIEPDVEA